MIDLDNPLNDPRQTFRTIDMPVQRVGIDLKLSGRRQRERQARGQQVGRGALYWLKRKLKRYPYRLIHTGDPILELKQFFEDYYFDDTWTLRISIRVLHPPPGVLEGVEMLRTEANSVTAPLPNLDHKSRLAELRVSLPRG